MLALSVVAAGADCRSTIVRSARACWPTVVAIFVVARPLGVVARATDFAVALGGAIACLVGARPSVAALAVQGYASRPAPRAYALLDLQDLGDAGQVARARRR